MPFQMPPRSFIYGSACMALSFLTGVGAYYLFGDSAVAGFLGCPAGLIGGYALMKLLVSKGVLPPS